MTGLLAKISGSWVDLLGGEEGPDPVTLSVIGPVGSNPWGQANLACQIRTTVSVIIDSLTFRAVDVASRNGNMVGIASAQPTGTVAWIGKATLTGAHDAVGDHTVALDAPVPMTGGVDYWLVFLGSALNTRYIMVSDFGSAVLTGLAKDASESFLYGSGFGSVWNDGGYPQITLAGVAA